MTSKTKVTYIISNIDKSLAFEWIAESMISNEVDLRFILLNNQWSYLEEFLISKGIPFERIKFDGTKIEYLSLSIKLLQKLMTQKPNVIHCHMFDACVLGLLSGWILGIPKRVFTRHSGSYNWQYNKKGLKYDKLLDWLATDVVAVSRNVHNLLQKEGVNEYKLHLIHHGFKLDKFANANTECINVLNEKYNPLCRKPVIGVISRWLHLKGIQYIIPAFKSLLKNYPDALLVLANSHGPYKPEIEELLSDLPRESYISIPFENDLFALYHLFDVYVHTPINPTIEAFGQTYVEALAASVPSVFTLSGVAPEFIEHEKNALVVPFEDSESIYKSIKRILDNPELKDKLVKNGKDSLSEFELDVMIKKLKHLYLN